MTGERSCSLSYWRSYKQLKNARNLKSQGQMDADFLRMGDLLCLLNSIFIALIPKVEAISSFKE